MGSNPPQPLRTATAIVLACLGALLAPAAGDAEAARAQAPTQLVFAASGRLWSVTPQGRGLHAFARVPGATVDVSASADGRRIAIITHRSVSPPREGSVRTIYLWRAGGGLRRLLRLRTVADSSVAISADGRLIAYGRDNEIWTMRSDGSGQRQITDGSRRAFDPAFAPSGKNLFFVRQSEANGWTAIFRRPLLIPYRSEIRLTPQDRLVVGPAASSRHMVAFEERGDGGGGGTPDRIRMMRPDGSAVRTLTRSRDPRFDLDPAFSPNGRSLVYVRLREVNGDRSPRRYSLRTIRASGANPRVAVARLPLRPRGLQWTAVPAGRDAGAAIRG